MPRAPHPLAVLLCKGGRWTQRLQRSHAAPRGQGQRRCHRAAGTEPGDGEQHPAGGPAPGSDFWEEEAVGPILQRGSTRPRFVGTLGAAASPRGLRGEAGLVSVGLGRAVCLSVRLLGAPSPSPGPPALGGSRGCGSVRPLRLSPPGPEGLGQGPGDAAPGPGRGYSCSSLCFLSSPRLPPRDDLSFTFFSPSL